MWFLMRRGRSLDGLGMMHKTIWHSYGFCQHDAKHHMNSYDFRQNGAKNRMNSYGFRQNDANNIFPSD